MGKDCGSKDSLQNNLFMRGSMKKTLNMDLESSNGLVGMCMKATTQKMNETAMGKCSGQMDQFTKENGLTEFNMEKER